MSFTRVAVLYGGVTGEREISLQTGRAVIDAVTELGLEPVPVDMQDRSLQPILDLQTDIVFIALHGGDGEDGKLQSVLELLEIPYTGCGPLASALAMDKVRCKQLWRGLGLPTEDFTVITEDADWQAVLSHLGGRVMVKPVREGSSLGMSQARTAQQLSDAYQLAAQFDSLVIAERWISGAELSVGILGDEVLPIIELRTDDEFYTYAAKYQSENTRYLCPAPLDEDQSKLIQRLSLDAFKAIDGRGWGRVDLMLDSENQPKLLEVNTVPGMTSHSLIPMAAREAGYSFATLVRKILDEAWHAKS